MTCFSLQTAVIFLYWLALTCQLHLVLLTLGVLLKSLEYYQRLSDSVLAWLNSYSTQHTHFISSRNCSFNCIVSFMGYAPGCVLYAKLLSIYMWNCEKKKKKKEPKKLIHTARPGFIIPAILTALNCIQSSLGNKTNVYITVQGSFDKCIVF